MAPTSDERREVASALRGNPNDTLIPQSRDGFEGMTYREAAYRFWDMCRRVRDAANVDIAYSTTSVLADLIDPTCDFEESIDSDEFAIRVVSGYICHACGHEAIVECTAGGWAEPPRYCPHCGARLVERDER